MDRDFAGGRAGDGMEHVRDVPKEERCWQRLDGSERVRAGQHNSLLSLLRCFVVLDSPFRPQVMPRLPVSAHLDVLLTRSVPISWAPGVLAVCGSP